MSRFHYLMDLHYSQTCVRRLTAFCGFTTLWIYTILKLSVCRERQRFGFTTLWIYTILKHLVNYKDYFGVSLPYGFTLFSNSGLAGLVNTAVSLPYGFTLFSN